MAVHLRTRVEVDRSGLDDEVAVRRCDVDPAGFDRLALFSVRRGEARRAAEDVGQRARSALGEVQHDEQRAGEVPGERPGETYERLDTAGGCADRDDAPLDAVAADRGLPRQGRSAPR